MPHNSLRNVTVTNDATGLAFMVEFQQRSDGHIAALDAAAIMAAFMLELSRRGITVIISEREEQGAR